MPIASVANKIILVPTYDSTGAKNKWDLTDSLDQATFDALVNQADKTKRWYPLPQLENVGGERADDVTETGPSGRKYRVKQGIRNFTAEIIEAGPEYKYQLDALHLPRIQKVF